MVRTEGKTCNPFTSKEICECPLDTEIIFSYFDMVRGGGEKIEIIPFCISKFKKLKTVQFRNHDIDTLKDLNGIKTLKQIYIDGSSLLKEIDGLDNLPSLKSLYISRCPNLVKVGKIDLPKLESITIEKVSNDKFELEPFDKLPRLKDLTIWNAPLSKIKNLEKVDKLEHLDLRFNAFNDMNKIEGLDKLKNLRLLALEGNFIEKIEGLNDLENLKKIYLSINEIKEFKGLDGLSNLTFLDVSNNYIKKIPRRELEKLKNLKSLFASMRGSLEIHFGKNKKLEYLDITPFDRSKKRFSAPITTLKIKKLHGLPSIKAVKLFTNEFNRILIPPVVHENGEKIGTIPQSFTKTRRGVDSRIGRVEYLETEWLRENEYEELV